MAKRNLVPLKVKIRDGAGYKYPDFNSLPCVQAWIAAQPVKPNKPAPDWSNYIDVVGSGWKYDNVGGFNTDDSEAGEGEWAALLLIDEQFADEAVAAFPDQVEELTERQAETFYDGRHAVDLPEEDVDEKVLTGIRLKQDLGVTLTAEDQKAIDPSDDTPGIRKNWRKKFADYKDKRNIEIKKNRTIISR